MTNCFRYHKVSLSAHHLGNAWLNLLEHAFFLANAAQVKLFLHAIFLGYLSAPQGALKIDNLHWYYLLICQIIYFHKWTQEQVLYLPFWVASPGHGLPPKLSVGRLQTLLLILLHLVLHLSNGPQVLHPPFTTSIYSLYLVSCSIG